jgi:hypothetical protein
MSHLTPLINSTEQISSFETHTRPTSQEIPRVLWMPEHSLPCSQKP